MLILLVVASIYSGYEFIRIKALIKVSGQLVAASKPYERHPTNSNYKILVVGDSTGVGTGAASNADSLAGRLGKDLPLADITNLAVNGYKTDQLLSQVRDLPKQKYDFILVHIGGNDIIRFRNLTQSAANIQQTLDILAPQSKQVAVFTTGNMGGVKLFPWAARPLFGWRSKKLRNSLKTTAANFKNVKYIDMYGYPQSLEQVHGYATDGLHLNASGYQLWYDALNENLAK